MTRPWQLQMFDRSLKKKQKLALLLDLMPPPEERECLLVTSGDNNGALNHHFRSAGGSWTWAEMEEEQAERIARFLGEPVHSARPDRIECPDASFDTVVTIDVHEHLDRPEAFNRELSRVVRPGGTVVVTTPSGDTDMPVARLKRWIGMTPRVYGHDVQGYTLSELREMLGSVGLEPVDEGSYSRFFTELIELAINFTYVKVLSGGEDGSNGSEGTIAPDSEESLDRVGASFRVYSAVYPLIRAFSSLDRLLPERPGYAVAVAARRAE